MNFIIFDLEATCWDVNMPSMTQEIIEIGAVMLNNYGENIGDFNKFVKPVLHPNISAYCTELTTITQAYLNKAYEFPHVIEEFKNWGNFHDEDFLLCSWGGFDKKMLIRDCQLHDLESDWAENHINLKQQYKEIKKRHRPIGLKNAIKREGFEFSGIHHRAISDAENLVKIFKAYIDEWKY